MKKLLKKQREFAKRQGEGRKQQNEVFDLQGVRSSGQAGNAVNGKQAKKNYSWKSLKSLVSSKQ